MSLTFLLLVIVNNSEDVKVLSYIITSAGLSGTRLACHLSISNITPPLQYFLVKLLNCSKYVFKFKVI